MEHTEKLFVYGTIVNPEIQKEILGRTVQGVSDILKGYEKSEVTIDGEIYPCIILNETGMTKGLLIEITDDELRKTDEYETDAYKRERIILKSGVHAWVYVRRF